MKIEAKENEGAASNIMAEEPVKTARKSAVPETSNKNSPCIIILFNNRKFIHRSGPRHTKDIQQSTITSSESTLYLLYKPIDLFPVVFVEEGLERKNYTAGITDILLLQQWWGMYTVWPPELGQYSARRMLTLVLIVDTSWLLSSEGQTWTPILLKKKLLPLSQRAIDFLWKSFIISLGSIFVKLIEPAKASCSS